ncbi:F0F1 ATP synthase subunit B [Canibacter sp. lx-45]|uniref:F0F1 ATP synthase subunit B n=1 Tax=Canibacter zhuwentaonis TaxID=2837491 RepID=UPI001BDBF413|nr:F0F1 ATP synthase subunit B [Canibacter zhuwentaonis]MBT1034795.1 F0F1 ATP synthase subunit B [Canibacter zhuwentaonis]
MIYRSSSAFGAEGGSDSSFGLLLPATYDVLWSAVCFAVILIFFWRSVLPKMQKLLDERSAAIEGNIAKADEAQAKAEAALQEYTEQLASARAEAGEIRENARSDANKIIAAAKADATAEQERIVRNAKEQIKAEQQSAKIALRKEVGVLAIDLASRVVSESLSNDQKANAIVDDFLVDLEQGETVAK